MPVTWTKRIWREWSNFSDYRQHIEIFGHLGGPAGKYAWIEKLVKMDRLWNLTIMAPGLQGEKQKKNVKWFDNKITSQYRSCNPGWFAFQDYQVRLIPTEVFISSHGKNWRCLN